MDWGLVGFVVALLVVVAASVVAVRRARWRSLGRSVDVQLAMELAVLEATKRGHAAMDVVHFAYALTLDPEGRVLFEGSGASLAALRSDLRALLATAPALTAEYRSSPTGPALSARVEPFLRRAASFQPLGVASLVIALTSEPDVGPVLARHGMTLSAALDAQRGGPDGTSLIIVNDEKTTMAFVVEALCEVLGVEHEEALAIAMGVHARGAARLAVAEAERVAGEMTARAEQAGFPLVVFAVGDGT